MSIYTKNGDNGLTNLTDTKNVSKSDDRIELIGTLEELISNIKLIHAEETNKEVSGFLEGIQKDLILIINWVSKPYEKDNKLKTETIQVMEDEIARLEEKFSIHNKVRNLSGNNKRSAQADVTRSIARRAERRLIENDKKYGGDKNIKIYMNRLSDYLYGLECMYLAVGESKINHSRLEGTLVTKTESARGTVITEDDLVQAVLAQMRQVDRVNLQIAKSLIEKVEHYCKERNKNAVVAICGPDGNMIAVHNMDGAFIASFDIAMKKAYTSVAVKMSTFELGKLAQPGGTFYGVDKADNGRLIIFGGGVPLMLNDLIIGGLGVSGGTGEEDHQIASYGQSILKEIMLQHI